MKGWKKLKTKPLPSTSLWKEEKGFLSRCKKSMVRLAIRDLVYEHYEGCVKNTFIKDYGSREEKYLLEREKRFDIQRAKEVQIREESDVKNGNEHTAMWEESGKIIFREGKTPKITCIHMGVLDSEMWVG